MANTISVAVGLTHRKFLAWLYIVKLESHILLRKMLVFWVKIKKSGDLVESDRLWQPYLFRKIS